MIKNMIKSTALATLLLGAVGAAEIDVKIVNATSGSHFTPLLVSVHESSTKLFMPGMPAGLSLQKMAEGGDISGLVTDMEAIAANSVENPAAGLLALGANATATLTTDATNDSLSIVAMILPANDGFVALNGWKVPTEPGTYRVPLHAYDAGTEANTEEASTIPGPAGGGEGFNTLRNDRDFVSIHAGAVTKDDGLTTSALSQDHKWSHPAARVVIERIK